MSDVRVGHGFDVHRFAADRDLILGGVRIEYERGLDGHSDADVVLHAIADALLGAAGLPDIGQQFPPSDPIFKDADSKELLATVVGKIREVGFKTVVNVDCVIMAQEPKLNPHIPKMRDVIAGILAVEVGRVGLKATTTEQLGFTGRGEGIAASAVCLISHDA